MQAKMTVWPHCGRQTREKCWRLSSLANPKGACPIQLATRAPGALRHQLHDRVVWWSVPLEESQRSAERSKTKSWFNQSRKRWSNPRLNKVLGEWEKCLSSERLFEKSISGVWISYGQLVTNRWRLKKFWVVSILGIGVSRDSLRLMQYFDAMMKAVAGKRGNKYV